MWNSPMGRRTCFGAEADLMRQALADLLACIDEEAETDLQSDGMQVARMMCGVPTFDRLAWHQKLAMLAQAGRALLVEDEPPPPVTALLDATLAALYGYIGYRVHFEVQHESRPGPDPAFNRTYRDLVEATYEHVDPEGVFLAPWPMFYRAESADWEIAIERLCQDFVINSKDALFTEAHLDDDPDQARKHRELERLPEDYYTAVPPDPSGTEIELARETLRELTQVAN